MTCDLCGRDDTMPYICKRCKLSFCVEHRMPESHSCGVLDYEKQSIDVREQGKLDFTSKGAVPDSYDTLETKSDQGMSNYESPVDNRTGSNLILKATFAVVVVCLTIAMLFVSGVL